MKLTKNSLILNKTDVNSMIARLDAISSDILTMRYALPKSYPLDTKGVINKPRFKRPFYDAINEANRIKDIKAILLEAGGNL